MRLKVTLQRTGGSTQDLLITCDGATTVGDLAIHLRVADPHRPPTPTAQPGVHEGAGPAEPVTIGLVREGHTALDPRTPLSDSPIHSGCMVTVTRPGELYSDPTARVAAVATVTAGPDAGREFPLASGTSIVGRVRSSEIRLTDPLVSRQHARINVSDRIEVIDLGSANGVELNGSLVSRAAVGPADEIRIGDTVLTVRMTQAASTQGRTDAVSIGFIRSPRLAPIFAGRTFEVPQLPQRQQRQRFPLFMVLMPVVMAVTLYAVTRQVSSILFAVLSPLMMLGSYLEQRRDAGRCDKAALAAFRTDLAWLVADADESARQEVAMRRAEHSSTAECVQAALQRNALLWTRRPANPGFLELRLGLGQLPSRSTVTLPHADQGPRDLIHEAARATAHLSTVDGVPVVARPGTAGAVGVCGTRSTSTGAAWALLVQAATLHSPAELAIGVIASTHTAGEWDWVKWLPHVDAAASPVDARHLACTPGAAARLIGAVETLIEQRAADASAEHGTGETAVVPAVLLVIESDAPVEFGRLVEVAERGWAHGIHVLWVAPELEQLPAACRTYLDTRSLSHSGVGYVHDATSVTPVATESISADEALQVAKSLAPVVDLGARHEDSSDLPRRLALLAIDGHEHLGDQPEAVVERWRQNHSILTGRFADAGTHREGSLRAVIGHSAGQLHVVDLRTDGPHALVGGTTGAGKSELLQTWILSMAANHSPQRLTFLLVDYKGGSAFADCARLPHTVGLVTDLNPNGVRRALTSLKAELRYREEVLRDNKVKDLIALEKKATPGTPPSLVIVVDEFAALVQEVPAFIDGVVDVAQRGRSLGLHLVLATQRPAGVIKDNLRANTNLRMALRVADEADSVDVLGCPDAAFFDQDLPGRAVSKTGPGRLVPFQIAYVGGHTTGGPPAPDIQVEDLTITAGATWEPPTPTARAETQPPGPTDIARVVTTIAQATEHAQLPEPRRPWLPDLLPLYDMTDPDQVPWERGDDALVFGIEDDPDNQRQRTIAFRPDTDGNLAVFGTGGSGKSTLLRTLAAATGLVIHGGPCHVYGLDFGSRGLTMLEQLPHVGSVVAGADDERIQRLIRWLRDLVAERAARYAAAGAGTIRDFRVQVGRPDEPRILLLVDGIGALRTAYESGPSQVLWDQFLAIAAEGRPVGVHVVVTADRPGALPTALASSIQQRVVLRLADPGDYGLCGVPADILTADSEPGRAVVAGREVQVAILGRAADTKSQADALAELAQAMRNAGRAAAGPVRKLPDTIHTGDLPAARDGLPIVGLRGDDLQPLAFEPRGTFVVVGPPGAGRTTTLHALAVALHRWDPSWRLVLLSSNRRSPLAGLPLWHHTALGADLGSSAKFLTQQIRDRFDQSGAGPAKIAIVVEQLPESAATEDATLGDLLAATLVVDGFFVAEGETTAMQSNYGVMGACKASRVGIALQPDSTDGHILYRTSFPPRLRPQDFPPGRGLYVARGSATTVQVMQPDKR
jgi:S-DNA-T family DNA segregation ATPase FtsK/SpoIIIE